MALFACEAKRRRENINKERARDPNWSILPALRGGGGTGANGLGLDQVGMGWDGR